MAPTIVPAALINIDAVAERLGVRVSYVRRLVNERRLRSYKIGTRMLRFDSADVDALILAGARQAVGR